MRQRGEMMSYSVLTQHSAQDGIRCIGTHCTEHVRGIDILNIRMDSYILEMRFDLWHGMARHYPSVSHPKQWLKITID